VEETEGDVPGPTGPSKDGRRKAAVGRLRFQYPDVFGRRRSRGGSTAAATRRRAINHGGINFRRRTAQAQTEPPSDAENRPEVSLNILYCCMPGWEIPEQLFIELWFSKHRGGGDPLCTIGYDTLRELKS